MATFLNDKERNVIPRWRNFQTTVAIGELKSSQVVNPSLKFPEGDFLTPKIKDWEENKGIAFASEVVGAALVLKRFNEADDAANFLLAQKEGVSNTLKSTAKKILSRDTGNKQIDYEDTKNVERENLQNRIHYLRNRLKEEPRNSITYVDLARAYTLLDENHKAEHLMNIAVKLSPNNRFVLRSASRLFIHTGEFEQAHSILRRAEFSKYDSWLLAAEISVASVVSNPSRFAKIGQRVIQENKQHPYELTELATALGMLELENGKFKDARKLFRKAIVSPTENSLAQVEWASRHKTNLDFVDVSNFQNIPLIHEAKAWELYGEDKWSEALKECWKWFYDQPFSDRPIEFGSYIASFLLGDYSEAIRLLEKGRIANPDNTTLLNNLAFSYASLGMVDKALKVFSEINVSALEGVTKIVVTATEGLIAFRSKDLERGRRKYLEAIQMASMYTPKTLLASAFIYYAREELIAETPKAEEVREIAIEQSINVNDMKIQRLVERELLKDDKAKLIFKDKKAKIHLP